MEIALKAQWEPFNALVQEMESFVPRPKSAFKEQRDKHLEYLRSINPSHAEGPLAKIADDQVELLSSEQFQFLNAFSDRVLTQFVTITLLSHALCEGGINAILAIGLARREAEQLFALLEKADIKEKWCTAPRAFCPTYHLGRDTALFETLVHLTKRRNAYVHSKVNLHDREGRQIFAGSQLEHITVSDFVRWGRRYFSLPYDLALHARAQMKDTTSSSYGIEVRSPSQMSI